MAVRYLTTVVCLFLLVLPSCQRAPKATLAISDATAYEARDSFINFTVGLNKNARETITVNWATHDDTATAGQDYTASSGTVTFNIGDKMKTISVPILNDTEHETEETFLVIFSNLNPKGSVKFLERSGSAVGTIVSEDLFVFQLLPEEEQSGDPGVQTGTITSQKKPKPVTTQTKRDDTVGVLTSKPETASADANAALTSKPETASADAAGTSGDISVVPSAEPNPLSKDGTGQKKFTMKQLVDSGLLGEGGSNAYYSYMTHILNKAHTALKQSTGGKPATDLFFLCNEEDLAGCIEKGLSLEQLNKPMIMRLIHVDGHAPSKFYKTEEGETFFVLQGEQITQNFIKDAMERMDQVGSKKILVNLPQNWNDLNWFFYFGSQLKEKQIHLHIVGQCGSFCANYSVPAAHKMVMEPYGHIGYNGNFSGLARDMETAYSTQLENSKNQFYQEHFSPNEVNGLVNLFERHSDNLRALMLFDQTAVGDMLNQVSRVIAQNPAPSFWDLSREGKNDLLSKIRQEVRDFLKIFFFELSGSTQVITNYYTFIQNVASAEADYYKKFRIIPEHKKDYSYLDFVNLTAWLTQNISYAQLFSLPRSYYNIPEKDKPYVAVFPDADILRLLGVNIQGENNTEVLHTLYENSENIFLFLSADDMENCNFFSKTASFTTDTLQECLSQDGSLL